MTPNQIRLVVYPSAAAIVAALVSVGFGYTAEADFMTLVSSASIHAELAAAIPANSGNAKGDALRTKLVADSRAFLERAERVAPNSSATCQVRAFLASIEGQHDLAADLYRRCRDLEGCTPDQLGPLVVGEAKSLSNAGRVDVAIALLAGHEVDLASVDPGDLGALRARLAQRAGDRDAALGYAAAVEAGAASGDRRNLIAGDLYEGLGAYQSAESAYRKSALRDDVRDYVIARLKLRAGAADEARSMLSESARVRDPEVLRLMKADSELWVKEIGHEEFSMLTGPAVAAPAPGAGR